MSNNNIKKDRMEIMPHLFMVRINKEDQKNFKQRLSKNSPFFIPVGSVHNSRNMECGEIVQIGEDMKGTDKYYSDREGMGIFGIYGWEKCKVGDTLIFHHNIESDQDKTGKRYFLFEDETYNYYCVDYISVRGFYDGKTVTPHPNWVFLKNVPAYPNLDEIDSITGNKVKKTEGGIFMVTSWKDSPQDIATRSKVIMQRIESLGKSTWTEEIQGEKEALEAERIALNRLSQKKQFLPYKVAFSNRKLDRDFGKQILEDDILYMDKGACLYISNFQLHDYTYIIALSEYCGGLVKQKTELVFHSHKCNGEPYEHHKVTI